VSKPVSPTAGLLERLRGALRLGRALRLVWSSAPGWTVVSAILVALQGIIPLALLYLTKLIIDEVAAGVGADDLTGAFQGVALLIAIAAGVTLLSVILKILGGLVSEILAHMVTDHTLNVVYGKSVELDYSFFEDPAYQDSLHRTQAEAPSRPTAVLNALLGIGQSGVTALGVIVLLVAVHWMLAAALFLALLPGVWVRMRFANRTYAWSRRRAALERRAGYFGILLSHAHFAKDIRTAGLGPLFVERFRDLRAILRKERLRLSRSRSLGDIATQAVASVVVFGAFAFLAFQTLIGALTLGALVMYFQAVQKGQSILQDLLSGVAGLYEHNLFLENLDQFMELEPQVVAPERPTPVPSPIRSGLVLDRVSFGYPGTGRQVLHEVSLEVRPGEMVALIGANGSGKTTLIKLLCRLYDPDGGAITLDGVDLRQFRPEELRRHTSVVFQDFVRYAFSVRDNLWFGRVHAPIDVPALEAAVYDAGFANVVKRMPYGYDTTLGPMFERNAELSGGEWQKLTLARAFYSDAQILILDEPSSALDARAEVDLFNHIRRHATDRAAVVISHRFSTVRMADRIYVLDDGRIVEGGTHDELMAVGGIYAHLFEIQAAPISTSRSGRKRRERGIDTCGLNTTSPRSPGRSRIPFTAHDCLSHREVNRDCGGLPNYGPRHAFSHDHGTDGVYRFRHADPRSESAVTTTAPPTTSLPRGPERPS
jgi:ATP-binding cassette, subfamily B, bacterial